MDMISVDSTGAPWVDQPVMLHSDRDYTCSLTPAQCAFQQVYWLFWYEADHRYGLSTIAFVLALIGFFALLHWFHFLIPTALTNKPGYRRLQARFRYLGQKTWRIQALRWWSPPLGVMLVGALGIIFFLSMMLGPRPYYWPNTDTLNYGDSPPIATRSGWMAIALLPFVLKANPISVLTGLSHDQLMVYHRWAAWAMFVLALVHTFPFIVYHTWKGDIVSQWNTSMFYWTGTVALLSQGWLQFMSLGILRHRFYEFFKAMHYVMAALFFTFLFIHCDWTLTSWDYLISAAVLYFLTLVAAYLRTFCEHGLKQASLTLLPSGLLRVVIPTHSTWTPGQHIYVRFLTLGVNALTIHPFTICSLPVHSSPLMSDPTEMVLYAKPHRGITARLAKLAEREPGKRVSVLLDGPYGGLDLNSRQSLISFDRAIIIAGGSGGGSTFPLIEDALRRQHQASGVVEKGSEAPGPDISVVVAFREERQAAWYQECIRELVASCGSAERKSSLEVKIYVTGKGSGKNASVGTPKEIDALDIERSGGSSDTDRPSRNIADFSSLHHGRPDLPREIGELTSRFGGSASVAVCGPAGMVFDVQNASAAAQARVGLAGEAKEVALHVESFGLLLETGPTDGRAHTVNLDSGLKHVAIPGHCLEGTSLLLSTGPSSSPSNVSRRPCLFNPEFDKARDSGKGSERP